MKKSRSKITVSVQDLEVGEFLLPLRKAYPLQTNKRRETTTKKAYKEPPPQGIQKNEQVNGEKMMISPFEVLAEHKGRGVTQAV